MSDCQLLKVTALTRWAHDRQQFPGPHHPAHVLEYRPLVHGNCNTAKHELQRSLLVQTGEVYRCAGDTGLHPATARNASSNNGTCPLKCVIYFEYAVLCALTLNRTVPVEMPLLERAAIQHVVELQCACLNQW